ncbi:hypothetical protein CAMRE0001_2257 [Campylobacter rectus RM3267]|uniref:Uncharacterized protein n=1 Tax=Campylobacter rectus RM3267 TaxID=553218 RepID=B9D397_CAMRE|nr:hypothetical protein CAMRE0001_2257 [Campylobacter rectus RM3267]
MVIFFLKFKTPIITIKSLKSSKRFWAKFYSRTLKNVRKFINLC